MALLRLFFLTFALLEDKEERKSIANNLSGEGYSKEVTGDILEKLGKTRLARTEEFSVQEFINLIDELKKEKTAEEME